MDINIENSEYELDLDVENTCRICLAQTGKLVNIFSNSVVDGYIIPIPQMLISCIDLKVTRLDGLPDKICNVCKMQVISFHSFKQKCKRSEKILQKIFKVEMGVLTTESKTIKEEIFQFSNDISKNSEENIEISLKNEKVEDEVSMDIIDEELVGSSDNVCENNVTYEIQNVSRTKRKTKNKKIPPKTIKKQCQICEMEFKTIRALNRHIDDAHKIDMEENVENYNTDEMDNNIKIVKNEEIPDSDEITVIDEIDEQTYDIDLYECILCSETFVEKSVYIDHCKSHDYYCSQCNIVFATQELFDHHEHNDISVDPIASTQVPFLYCTRCNKKMKSKQELLKHGKLHETMNLITTYLEFYGCNECYLMFLSEDQLQEHKKVHSETVPPELFADDRSCTDYQFLEDQDDKTPFKFQENIPYRCGICFSEYPTANDLKCHIVLHSEKFSCPFDGCGCEYDMFSRLSIHMMNKHIFGQQHSCVYCNSEFPGYHEMLEHMRKDCIERKFKCTHCDKSFFSKRTLNHHLKHTDEKKYMCQFCGKSFAQHGELVIHNRSHTGERPFKCTICGKAYKTASMRTAHMDAHIDGKTFQCTFCDIKLQTRTSYRNHMRRHTEDKKHVCATCGKKFFTKYHLKIHHMKIHQNVRNTQKNQAKILNTKDIKISVIKLENNVNIIDNPIIEFQI